MENSTNKYPYRPLFFFRNYKFFNGEGFQTIIEDEQVKILDLYYALILIIIGIQQFPYHKEFPSSDFYRILIAIEKLNKYSIKEINYSLKHELKLSNTQINSFYDFYSVLGHLFTNYPKHIAPVPTENK